MPTSTDGSSLVFEAFQSRLDLGIPRFLVPDTNNYYCRMLACREDEYHEEWQYATFAQCLDVEPRFFVIIKVAS